MDTSALYFTEIINIQSFLFGLVTLLIIRWFMTRPKCTYNLPPGPISFPLIGNLPQMITTKDINNKMKDLRKQYGDIFKIKVGPDIMVIVCKTEWILEGLVKKGDQLKGRPYWNYLVDKLSKKKGISFSVGKEWKDLKKFSISTLRDLGMGKRSIEEQIYLETQKLGEAFESHNGKPFSLGDPLPYFSLSIIHNIIFGERIICGEPGFQEIVEQFRFFFKNVSAFIPESFFPFLRFLRWNSPVEQLIKNDKKIQSYILKKITEHKETFNAEYIRDFIDMYLLTLEKEPNSESLSEANMFRAIIDIFMGGTDTTATYLNWAFLYMAKHPDIQNKCREEIKEEIVEQFRFFFKNVSAFIPESFFPFLRFLRWNSPVEQLIKNDKKIQSYILKKITEHKETFNAEYIRDFIDMYLLTLEKEPNSESLSEANMFRAIIDIFMGGTDTTATYLNWAFLYMAKHPDIQNKCREEIKEITNLNRPVRMEDKRHLTYVAATLLEVHRIAPVAPLSVPHASEVDTTLGGYDIPQNTVVSFMLIDAHYDPKYWDKPEEFRPERWIGVNNELLKNEAFMPFSLGPRICAGISLANIESFIAFTNILQKFQFERPDETSMTMEGRQSGITYMPVNDNIRAIAL